MRPVWLWTGAVMWLLAFAAIGGLWFLRPAPTVLPDPSPPAVADSAGQPAATITLSPTASSTGSSVIDLAELVQQKSPGPPAPMWSPDGIEDFTFTNCDGRTITKADLLGKPWAVCFVFTKCLGPCPIVTRQMKQLQDRLKEVDVRLVTLTVDPFRDTPEALLAYARLNGADLSKWLFLSGDQHEIYRLIQGSFRMPVQEVNDPGRKEGYEFIHSTNVMLVDAQGVVQRKFNATKDSDMAELRRELIRRAQPSSTEPAEVDAPVASGR